MWFDFMDWLSNEIEGKVVWVCVIPILILWENVASGKRMDTIWHMPWYCLYIYTCWQLWNKEWGVQCTLTMIIAFYLPLDYDSHKIINREPRCHTSVSFVSHFDLSSLLLQRTHFELYVNTNWQFFKSGQIKHLLST